jgi:hypothetical protein
MMHLPGSDEDQLEEAARIGVESSVTVSRMAAERGAGIQRVKARSAKRAIEKIARGSQGKQGKASSEQIERLRARVSSHQERGAILADHAQLLRRREELKASLDRAATYGRTVDAKGAPVAGVPVALVSDGKIVESTKTDEQGYFAISAPPDLKGDVAAHIGEKGAHGIYPLTRDQRPTLVLPLMIRLEGKAAHGKPSAASRPVPEQPSAAEKPAVLGETRGPKT